MAKMILVVGGTGMLGEPVACRLRGDGYQVRIFTRNPQQARAKFGAEYEAVVGDVEDQSALLAALQGCQAVHVNLDGGLDPDLERRGAENVARAAARNGIHHITLLSGTSVREENCWYAGTKAKFEAEAAVRASGVPYTIFQATFSWRRCPFRARHAREHPRQPAVSLALGRGRRLRPHGLQSVRDAGGGEQDAACFRAAALDDAPGAANLLRHRPPGCQGQRDPLLDGITDRRPVARQGTRGSLALLPLQRQSRRSRRSGRGQCLARRADDHAGAMVQGAGGAK